MDEDTSQSPAKPPDGPLNRRLVMLHAWHDRRLQHVADLFGVSKSAAVRWAIEAANDDVLRAYLGSRTVQEDEHEG